MNTLSHVRGKLGGGREPAEPWVKPWPGPTVWVVTEPDWEHTEIHGVAATIEAAWEIVRALPRCPQGAMPWEQDERTGMVHDVGEMYGGRYSIEPYELSGAAEMGA